MHACYTDHFAFPIEIVNYSLGIDLKRKKEKKEEKNGGRRKVEGTGVILVTIR